MRYLGGIAPFDIAAVEHVDGLAVLEQRDRGRGRGIVLKDGAQVGYSGIVAAGKDGSGYIGPDGVLQGESDAGPGFACRTAAYGINHHHHGAIAGSEDTVNFFWSASFFDAEAGEIFPHGDKESFGIGHALNVAELGVLKGIQENRQ
jgi:hypothetical protein